MTFSLFRRRARAAALALGAVCALASCFPPGLSLTRGTLVVQIDIAPIGARTLLPPIDMTVATWVVSGTGPGSATFSVNTTGAAVTIPALAVGSWTVNVDGKNAAGTFIAHGSASVSLTGGSTQTVSMVASPIVGYGTLSLSVTWPATSVLNPVISATLTPPSASAQALPFSAPASGASSYTGSNLLNGYYTLAIQLLDGMALVAGAVDVVRIVAGQTTSGTFAFTAINPAMASIAVNITPQVADPIPVTLSGVPSAVATGAPFTASASVPASVGNVTDVWYVNGVSTDTGSSVTLNPAANPLAVGTYRIDVVAFSADGLRAGAATATLTVTTTSTVNVAWNPNTETNIASYTLYLGTASGAYTSTVSPGKTTTASLAGLLTGQTYYAAVTATNTSGLESPKSAEISFKAP